MPPDELRLDGLPADLVAARAAVSQLYSLLERSVLVLEQAIQDREALIVRLSDMGVVADALMAERDAARSALEELRRD